MQQRKLDPIPAGFHPFWFWNDELSAEEIRWQIAEMARAGIRGFHIHSRQGLKQPYLSQAFFEMVDVAIEAAEKHGLVVHLYDEYPYPSGAAGGETVLGNPQLWATWMVQQTQDVPGGKIRLALPAGEVLSCCACPIEDGRADWTNVLDLRERVGMVLADETYVLMGLTKYNAKRYFACNPTPTLDATLPDRPHRIFFSVQVVIERNKYFHHVPDVINPEAIKRFIALTHQRYFDRYGRKFGSRILSIFTDEVSLGWSRLLVEEFAREYGYDLLPVLPALQDENHPRHIEVTTNLERLKHKLFCERFEVPVSQWCRGHGLRYAGEKPSRRLSQLQYMDIPGCDCGHTKAGDETDLLGPSIRTNARAAASAAYFYGKEGSLCECYHSLGWGATLQDAKVIAESLMLMGITYLVPHGFFYSTASLRKHDAPPSFFFQMPYWPLFGRLSKRLDRLARQFEGTHMEADILVVDPNGGLPTEPIREYYRKLLGRLVGAHLDFLIVDTDILQAAVIADGRAAVRDIKAWIVIVPPMRVVEEPLAAWLNTFASGGGKVIRCDIGGDQTRLLEGIVDQVQPRLLLRAEDGDAAAIQMVSRSGGGRRLWFLLNTSGRTIRLRIDSPCLLREQPLDEPAAVALTGATGRYSRVFEPFESVLLEAAESDADQPAIPRVSIPIDGPMKMTPMGKNLLRMDPWEMTLLVDDKPAGSMATVPAVPLANQLSQGNFPFAPKVRMYFGTSPEFNLPELRARCSFSFENDYAGPVELVMERESILGDWRILVNDSPAITQGQFTAVDAHVRGSLGVDITSRLVKGRNTISVEFATRRPDGGLRNPLYLAGDFGVLLNPTRLVVRGETGGFETYQANGLPYFSGVVEYETMVDVNNLQFAEQVFAHMETASPFWDACEISFNRGPWHSMPWSPRQVLLSAGELKAGANNVLIRVYTTLIRSFEGRE